jgi:hypothetical protein
MRQRGVGTLHAKRNTVFRRDAEAGDKGAMRARPVAENANATDTVTAYAFCVGRLERLPSARNARTTSSTRWPKSVASASHPVNEAA